MPSVYLVLLAAALSVSQNALREAPQEAAPPAAAAQPPATTPPTVPPAEQPPAVADQNQLTTAIVEERRKQAEANTELSDEVKKSIAESYQRALSLLQKADELVQLTATNKTAAETVAERAATLKQSLGDLRNKEPAPAEIPPAPTLDLAEDTPYELRRLKLELHTLEHRRKQLEQALAQRELRVNELKQEQAKTDGMLAARVNRRKEWRAAIESAPRRLDDLNKKLSAAAPADEPPPLTLARRTELEAQRLVLTHEPAALQSQLANYDAEDASDIVRLQRDLVLQQLTLANRERELTDRNLRATRSLVNEMQVKVAAEEAVHSEPLLAPYARLNAELAAKANDLTPLINTAESDRDKAQKTLDVLRETYKQDRQKVDTVGLSHSLGALLRKHRAELPDIGQRRSNVRSRQETIDEAQLAYFNYDEQRSDIVTHTDAVIRGLLRGAPANLKAEELEKLQQSAQLAVQRRKEYLDALRTNYSSYFDTLVELSAIEQQMIETTREYAQFIDERVLWIRSSQPLNRKIVLADAANWPSRFNNALGAGRWLGAVQAIWSDLRWAPGIYIACGLLLVALVYLGARMRREIGHLGEQAQRGTCMTFRTTARAALLTVLVSVPYPLLVGFFAWRLTTTPQALDFARAVGHGLRDVMVAFLPLELLRQICRPQGLAAAHFNWPASATRVLRRSLRTVTIMGLPLALLASTLAHLEDRAGEDFLERLFFILGTIVVASFLRKVLRPRGGVLQEHIAYHQGGWIDRLQYVWYWLAVLSPFVLAGLTFLGYFYTAHQLAWRLFLMFWMLVGLLVLQALLNRLLLVLRRKMTIEKLRERSAQASDAAASGTTDPLHPAAKEDDPFEAIKAQTEQSRRLISTCAFAVALIGIWWTWVDVLPALSLLDRWPLWTSTYEVTEPVVTTPGLSAMSDAASTEEAATENQTIIKVDKVTIADLAFAIIIGVMTIIAARNVPGLTEIAILKRLPLDNSIRYAITTLVSYAIGFVGLVMACNLIGLRWQQIQWLATALTFGLAFGLQEMFANFVAGIILLFERPIRVGDVITIGDTTGVVSRIRMRATTITNWDRKEFVVPNKEFITGRLLNWTLSDQVNRIVINVGVAYGTDTERARQLLLKVAQDHPLTLDEPKSVATFEGFGDSALLFCLRTFLPNMENRLQTIHDLHTAIDRAFRAAGVVIAFPQLDIHVHADAASAGPATGESPTSSNGNGSQRGQPPSSDDAPEPPAAKSPHA